jgi:hypothetical protein
MKINQTCHSERSFEEEEEDDQKKSGKQKDDLPIQKSTLAPELQVGGFEGSLSMTSNL